MFWRVVSMKTDEIQAAVGASVAGSGIQQGHLWFRRFWRWPDWRRWLRWDFGTVRVALAGLLLVAAALKAEQLWATSPQPFASPTFALIVFEFAFAAWLLTGGLPRFTWWLAVACFTAFALVAGAKTLSGQSDCGCFGAVSTAPVVALVVDLAALTVLLATHPGFAPVGFGRASLVRVMLFLVFALGLLRLAVRRENVLGLPVPDGSPLHCAAPQWDFGSVDPSALPAIEHVFRLENRSANYLRIQDVKTDCGCLIADRVWQNPIEPGGVLDLPVRIALPASPGRISRSLHVLLDKAGSPLRLQVTGEIDSGAHLLAFPAQVNFGEVVLFQPPATVSRVIFIRRYNADPLGAVSIRSSDNRIRVMELSDSPDPSTRRYRIECNVASYSEALELRSEIEFHTGLPNSVVVVPVTVKIRSPFVEGILLSGLHPGASVQVSLFNGHPPGIIPDEVRYEGDPVVSVTWCREECAHEVTVHYTELPIDVPLVATGHLSVYYEHAQWHIPVTVHCSSR